MLNVRIVILLLSCVIVSLFSCAHGATSKRLAEREFRIDVSMHDYEWKRSKFPLTVYATPSATRGGRSAALRFAALRWHELTRGIVVVDVVDGWVPPEPFDVRAYSRFDVPTVWSLDPSNLIAIESQRTLGAHLAFTSGNVIVAYDDQEIDELRWTLVHELGHLFGLAHLDDEYVGVMNKHRSVHGLTTYDLMLFCSVYNELCEVRNAR